MNVFSEDDPIVVLLEEDIWFVGEGGDEVTDWF
jgi:hypothetical protein